MTPEKFNHGKNPEYSPEILQAYEAIAKYLLLNGSLRVAEVTDATFHEFTVDAEQLPLLAEEGVDELAYRVEGRDQAGEDDQAKISPSLVLTFHTPGSPHTEVKKQFVVSQMGEEFESLQGTASELVIQPPHTAEALELEAKYKTSPEEDIATMQRLAERLSSAR